MTEISKKKIVINGSFVRIRLVIDISCEADRMWSYYFVFFFFTLQIFRNIPCSNQTLANERQSVFVSRFHRFLQSLDGLYMFLSDFS